MWRRETNLEGSIERLVLAALLADGGDAERVHQIPPERLVALHFARKHLSHVREHAVEHLRDGSEGRVEVGNGGDRLGGRGIG
jgi:hypothetical protein